VLSAAEAGCFCAFSRPFRHDRFLDHPVCAPSQVLQRTIAAAFLGQTTFATVPEDFGILEAQLDICVVVQVRDECCRHL